MKDGRTKYLQRTQAGLLKDMRSPSGSRRNRRTVTRLKEMYQHHAEDISGVQRYSDATKDLRPVEVRRPHHEARFRDITTVVPVTQMKALDEQKKNRSIVRKLKQAFGIKTDEELEAKLNATRGAGTAESEAVPSH